MARHGGAADARAVGHGALHARRRARPGAEQLLARHPRRRGHHAGGVFTIGAGASLLHLVKARADARNRIGRLARGLPDPSTLERLTYATTLFAFPVWTFAVIAGAIWAEDAWGRYWGWDPKETWAFITWVLYAAYLHASTTAGWRSTRAQALAIAGYTSFVFNFFGVNLWITGLHSYAGV